MAVAIPSKNKLKTQKSNKSRWLDIDTNFKLLHIGCPVSHEFIDLPGSYFLYLIPVFEQKVEESCKLYRYFTTIIDGRILF